MSRRLLLDTNAWSMVLVADPRLPRTALDMIETAGEVWISAISLYEIGRKTRLGKWPAMLPFAADLVTIAERDQFHLMPVTPAIALNASLLDWPHRDPFDRIIAATTLDNDWLLISSDDAFDTLPSIVRHWD